MMAVVVQEKREKKPDQNKTIYIQQYRHTDDTTLPDLQLAPTCRSSWPPTPTGAPSACGSASRSDGGGGGGGGGKSERTSDIVERQKRWTTKAKSEIGRKKKERRKKRGCFKPTHACGARHTDHSEANLEER